MASGASRTAHVHWSLEQAVFGLALLAGFPAAVALAWIVWEQDYSFEVRWTRAAVVVAVWVGCAIAAHQMVTRVLYLAANLLGALHEGHGSDRRRGLRVRQGREARARESRRRAFAQCRTKSTIC